ncbi:MAG: J domain-containing protein [Caldilineae bacterium]|nr:MAG: J domain-containing protein [Caldilineae bacterium]
MEVKDYYRILGVSKDADEKEIKKAYRKLARQYHPDMNPGDAEAEQRFKEISEAYAVLSDPEKRKKYDRFGAQWEQYERAGVNPDDFARGFGGFGSPGGQTYTRTITPEEFEQIFGGFGGSGGMGGGMSGFSDFFESLFGGGPSRTRQRSGFEGFSTRTPRPRTAEAEAEITLEEAFHGTTRTLQREDGRRIEVTIPKGVRTGSKVRAGDVTLRIRVKPHSRFRREGDDLYVTVPVDLYTAVLGGEVQVPTLERPVMLTIPAGTQNGKRFRLRGLGMPKLKTPDQRGDLYAEVEVQVPTRLSPEERRLFEQLRALRR